MNFFSEAMFLGNCASMLLKPAPVVSHEHPESSPSSLWVDIANQLGYSLTHDFKGEG